MLVAVQGSASSISEKLENGNWTEIDAPPIDEREIYGYAAIFYGTSHYYFGGWSNQDTTELSYILALQEKTWTWSNLGLMKTTRHAHSVILVDQKFMLLGGGRGGIKNNEACILNNGEFSCTEFSSSLDHYVYYPILYLVDENYKSC